MNCRRPRGARRVTEVQIDEIRENLQRSDVFVTDMHIHYTSDALGNKFELNGLPHDLVKNFMLDAFSRMRTQLENQFMHL